jgi:hypothetical protein
VRPQRHQVGYFALGHFGLGLLHGGKGLLACRQHLRKALGSAPIQHAISGLSVCRRVATNAKCRGQLCLRKAQLLTHFFQSFHNKPAQKGSTDKNTPTKILVVKMLS